MTRKYGKLNKEIYTEAIKNGLTKVKSGKLAGLKAKSTESIINTVNNQLIRDGEFSERVMGAENEYKKNTIQLLEEIRDEIVRVLREKKSKISDAKLGTLTLSLAQIIDKIQLLKGDVTERIETLPRLVIDEVEVGEEDTK